MFDTGGNFFVYHVIKPLQFFLDNVSDFIWYSKVTFYIVHFEVVHVRNSYYSPQAITLKCTIFSYLPPSNLYNKYDYCDYEGTLIPF